MKKRLVALLLSASMLLSSQPLYAAAATAAVTPQAATGTGFKDQLESKYIDPDRVYSSDVRWWLGSASATDETLLEEIQALYDGGFRGVELCMQTDGTEGKGGSANKDYAYGSEMWSHKWKLMMNKLLDLGMGVYLTAGTNWATSNVPASSIDPGSQDALQVLAMPGWDIGNSVGTPAKPKDPTDEKLILSAGDSVNGDLQKPGTTRSNCTLQAVYAYEIDKDENVLYGTEIDLMKESGAITKKPAPVTPSDAANTESYTLNWKAPDKAGARYLVIPYWAQGAYNSYQPGVEPCYTTNYFDERGVEKLKEFWTDHYLDDPELNAKIKKGDVQLFMDSLELTYGDGFTWWCEDAREEFNERKGYDIMPYIFLISGVGSSFSLNYNTYPDHAGIYDLSGDTDGKKAAKIINDWQDVMTQLYEERMLQPLKTWLNSVGIETRAQISYGKPFEISEPSQYVDYPEVESLNHYNQVDIFRLTTGAAKLENKVLSIETGGELKPYSASYQNLLRNVYSEYAAGIQRVIWHIWTASYGYANCEWGGYISGGNGFYRWGNREPSYQDYDEFNAHIGRVQQLLQTGKARTDIGFVHKNWVQGVHTFGEDGTYSQGSKNWLFAHEGVYYRSTELQDHGYTYDYFSPEFLNNKNVTFNKTTKTLESSGYKALVIYQKWLDVEAAKNITSLAQEGMPVVILENAAVQTPYADDQEEELANEMAKMKALPTVRVAKVSDPIDYFRAETGGFDDEVYEKLQELGVRPYAEFVEENHQLLTQSREDASGNRYMYAYNYCPNDYHSHSSKTEVRREDHGTNIETEIRLDGRYVPYIIDAWTGEVTELGAYRYENGKTVVPIDLDYGNVALYAFEAVAQEKAAIQSTNADLAYRGADGQLKIRATKTGDYKTTLGTGKTYTSNITVPASYDIRNWDVKVTSWTASDQEGDLQRSETMKREGKEDLTTVNKKTSTVKKDIPVKLDTLTTWDKMPGVGKGVSGEAVYKASFNWDASNGASGAYIDLGNSLDQSMKIWINGKKVGGAVSTNSTKVKKGLGGVESDGKIDDGTGNRVALTGRDQYTGGINWMVPKADITEYLKNGENTIEIRYNSALTNAMLAKGQIQRQTVMDGKAWFGPKSIFWDNDGVDYRQCGPKQAKIVPYVDMTEAQLASASYQGQASKNEADLEQAKKDAQAAKAEADKAKAEAQKAKAEADKAVAASRADAQAKVAAAQAAQKKAEEAAKKAEEAQQRLTFKQKKVTLSSVKSKKIKQVVVTWKRIKGADSYTVQYSKKAKMTGAKSVTVKKDKTVKKTLKKLTSNKKYYVRVRANKKIGGKKVYTAWSKVKSIRVK